MDDESSYSVSPLPGHAGESLSQILRKQKSCLQYEVSVLAVVNSFGIGIY